MYKVMGMLFGIGALILSWVPMLLDRLLPYLGVHTGLSYFHYAAIICALTVLFNFLQWRYATKETYEDGVERRPTDDGISKGQVRLYAIWIKVCRVLSYIGCIAPFFYNDDEFLLIGLFLEIMFTLMGSTLAGGMAEAKAIFEIVDPEIRSKQQQAAAEEEAYAMWLNGQPNHHHFPF